MGKVYRTVLGVSWGLGVICMVASLVLKLLPSLEIKLDVTPRGGIVMAAVLFLCALATGEAGRTPPSS
ncbi:MAG: hypothetical protein WB763_01690 [Terriglobia bacterium]|jgi:hypothetical protein